MSQGILFTALSPFIWIYVSQSFVIKILHYKKKSCFSNVPTKKASSHTNGDEAFRSIPSFELDELVDASAALDHGFDEAAPDVEDDDARMVAVFEGFLEGFGKFILCGDGLRLDAETLGVLDVVHRVVEFAGYVALLVHDFLELADHAEAPVVDDQGDDRQLQARDRVELVARHLDATVAGHVDDAPVPAVVELCAHGGRQAEAHRA